MSTTIDDAFNEAMLDVYRRAKSEADYNARIFVGMVVEHGGLATARYLLHEPNVSEGYTALWGDPQTAADKVLASASGFRQVRAQLRQPLREADRWQLAPSARALLVMQPTDWPGCCEGAPLLR